MGNKMKTGKDNHYQRVNKDNVSLNRALAYKGSIGQLREDFCRYYIEHQQAVFKTFKEDLIDQANNNKETITCQPGCCYCCYQFFLASLQECEAIVYYLYQNDTALTGFLEAYPLWRAKVREIEATFTRIQQLANEVANNPKPATREAYAEATNAYLRQDIKCPFLNDGLCSIYEVRPFACASIAATTAGEWCSPLSINKPKVYSSRNISVQIPYFRKTRHILLFPMPLAVYEILNYGFTWLAKLPGLENLDNEVMSDPEVLQLLRKSK